MTYILPAPYKCLKCDFEFDYSPHGSHPAPVLTQQVETDKGIYTQHMPVCPSCYGAWIKENLGLALCTQKFTSDESDYESNLAKRSVQ